MNVGLLAAALSLFGFSSRPSAIEVIAHERERAIVAIEPPLPRPKVRPEQAAKLCRRVTRAKRPGRFGYFGHKARYHFDPATSNANRHKRVHGESFDGFLGRQDLA